MNSNKLFPLRSIFAAVMLALLAMTAVSSAQSDATLSDLAPSVGTLVPVFASGTFIYTSTVPFVTTSMTVTPTATDLTFLPTITVNGNIVASGNPSAAISLNVGDNVITNEVVSNDTLFTNIYTHTVTRTAASSNADLSNLVPSAGTLTPAFASNTISYTATVPNATTSLTVTPTAADVTATITVNGSPVASGNPSGSISLGVGATNVITTEVTAEDASTKTYTLTVTRAAPSTNANLASLVSSTGTLTPAFNSNTISYTASVPYATNSMTVKPTAADTNATITVNGISVASGVASAPISLGIGATNVITTVVVAQDLVTTNTYTLTVTRTGNAFLASLLPSGGTLKPTFASNTYIYTASVPYTTNSITVTPTASDPLATITVNGIANLSGAASAPISLGVGATTVISTVVISQDASATNTYTLTVMCAAKLYWDRNATGVGQVDGAGAWLTVVSNVWWDGVANNVPWTSGSDAVFGNGGAGGAVTLASPTTVSSMTFSNFTGTYTLGTAGQTITLSNGITKTAGTAATFVSPITLAAAQSWTNNSSGTLTTANGTNLVNNAGYQLTVGGTGNYLFGVANNAAVVLAGSGALVKSGSGRLEMGGINSNFTGSVTINSGVLMMYNDAGGLGNGNVSINGGVHAFYWGATYTRSLGTNTSQAQIPGGESGYGGSGTTGPTVNLGNPVVWGASGEGSATGFFNPSKFVLGDPTTGNAGLITFSSGINLNGATRTIVVPKGNSAGGNRSTISGVITNSTGAAGLVKEGNGLLFFTANNTYNGSTTVSDGMVDFAAITLSGFGGGSGRNISVAAGATVRRNTLDNAFLNRLVETNAEIGVMTGTTANNLDFSSSTGANLPNAFLGNWAGNGAKMEYSGILTPASDNYRLGAPRNSGLLGMRNESTMSGNRGLIIGSGSVELVGPKTFTGDTVIRNGARLGLAAIAGAGGVSYGLQNSALDTGTPSSTGTIWFESGGATGPITGSSATTSAVFGGLKGSRNLGSVYSTTTGANNSAATAVASVTGFTLNVGTGNTCSYSGVIANFAAGTILTKTGLGTQILSGTNTYTGNTLISLGTLALGATGSISNTASLTIGGLGTLDVSAKASPYTLPTSLNANGGAPGDAIIKGPAAGTVSLGTQPITLAYDGSNPALIISQGALQLNGQTITVNTPNSNPLANGTYNIINVTGGSIVTNGTCTLAGTAGTGTIDVSGANVQMTITGSSAIATTTALSGNQTNSYGTDSTITATVTPSSASGGVQFYVDAVPFGSPVTVAGGVATIPSTAAVPLGTHTIAAVYSGDGTYAPSATTSVATLTMTTLGLTIDSPAVTTKTYNGTTNATITANLPGVLPADIGLVNLVVSGGFISPNAGTNIPVSTSPWTLTGTKAPNYTLLNQPSGLTGTILPASTATSLKTSQSLAGLGSNVTFTAKVVVVPPGGGTLTDSVQFLTNGTLAATVPLDGSGNAAYSTALLPKGSTILSANYVGGVNYDASSSANLLQAVTNSQWQVFSNTFNLGDPGFGTNIAGQASLPWSLGSLATNTFLVSVSIDAKLESTDNSNWAAELAVLADPTPGSPGLDGLLTFGPNYVTNQLGMETWISAQNVAWANGYSGTNNAPVVDTKTVNANFNTIDLSSVGLLLANSYGGPVIGGTWSGTVTVTYASFVNSPVAPNPTLLTNSVSGGTLSLSWPSGQGWRLQEQTNSRSVGLRTNWVDVTDASVNSTNITVDKTMPTTFYRLIYP